MPNEHPREIELLKYFMVEAGKGLEEIRAHVYGCRKCQEYLMGHDTATAKLRLRVVEGYSKDNKARSSRQRAGIQKLFNR